MARDTRFIALAASVACVTLPVTAWPQSYPAKPVRAISQFLAGSGGDTFARPVMEELSKLLGQPVIMDNRAGAGGLVAAEAVSRSAADGYTLLIGTTGVHIARPFLVRKATFNLLKDLTPITGMGDTPLVLVGNPSLPFGNFKELIAYAKANPGKLSYGSSGIGSTAHLTAEQIKMLTGVDIVHVPYKGSAAAVLDVVAGRTSLSYSIVVSVRSSIHAGKLKGIAVATTGRAMGLPDVPNIDEALPGFEPVTTWTSMFGPPDLPKPIVMRLNAETNRALKAREARIREVGFDPVGSSTEHFVASIEKQTSLVARIVKAAGVQPE